MNKLCVVVCVRASSKNGQEIRCEMCKGTYYVSTFPATVTAGGEWRHTTPEQTQITWISRPIVDQEKSAIDDDAVARTKVGLYCTRRS